MSLRARLGVVLSVCLLAAGGAMAWTWMGQMDRYRPRIIQLLEQITERTVLIESVSISLAEGFLLDLAGVEIRAKDPKAPPLLTARHVQVGIGLEFFLRKRLSLSSVSFISPQFNLVRYPGGSLLEQAHRTALASERALTQSTGDSISQIHVGRVNIRDGLLNLADWGREDDQTLVFDKIQANLYQVSPAAPSPLTATARFHSVPFKINGQIGPLPASLNPDIMPVLLSFEAKTIEFSAIADLLPVAMEDMGRGYFSALIHGTLQKGLATSSWLQVEKAVLPAAVGKGVPMALALRQKSRFYLGREPQDLEIQELFVYVDGSPVLTIKGGLGIWPPRQMALAIETVRPIALEDVTLPAMGMVDGLVSGTLQLTGDLAGDVQLQGVADLTRATWLWPALALDKQSGIPLTLHPGVRRNAGQWSADRLRLVGDEQNSLQLDGKIHPLMALSLRGDWDLEHLRDYISKVGEWPLTGRVRWESRVQPQQEPQLFHWLGDVAMAEGQLGTTRVHKLASSFQWNGRELLLSPIKLGFEKGGMLEGTLLLNAESKNYGLSMVVSGAPVAVLPDLESGPGLAKRLEGLLQLEGEVSGAVSGANFPMWPASGRFHVVMEPGGLLGVGNSVLTDRPTGETTLAQAGKTFYWERGSAELLLTDAGVRLNDLRLETGQAQITGSGWVERGQGLDLLLMVEAPWWKDNSPLWAELFGTLDDLRLKPVGNPGL